MKRIINIFALALVSLIATNCDDEYTDPINEVAPGPDEAAPVVTVNYPFEGAQIRVKQDVTAINIQFQVTDDIEIKTISLSLDGEKLADFDNFIDYRKAVQSFQYNTLTNGIHTLTVMATDLANKSTTATVHFEKVEPYQPTYPGEIIYMPFDGDYLELLSITEGTKGGTPTFVDGLVGKAVHFDAANKGYVLFPGEALAATTNFSLSFWVRPEFVDANGDNGIDGILGLVNLANTKRFWGNVNFFVENGSNPTAAKMRIQVTSDGTESWIDQVNNVPDFFGQWTHHVVTYDNTAHELKYYINGDLMNTKAVGWGGSLTFKDSGPIVLGTVQFMTTPSLTSTHGAEPWASYLTGEMDEVRIFNKALSAAEVQQIYDDIN